MSILPIVQGHRPGLLRRLGYLLDTIPKQFRSSRLYQPSRAVEQPKVILIPTDARVPILDQGIEGACAGHAAAEGDYLSALRADPLAQLGSRQWYYRCGRVLDGTLDTDAGTNFRAVFTEAASVGVPPETAWPYRPKTGDPDGNGSSTDQFRENPPAEVVRLAFDRRSPPGELEASPIDESMGDISDSVDHALASDLPVCWAGDVDDDFCTGNFDPSVPVQMPAKRSGGHAMVIVGRTLVTTNGVVARWYRVRNSWSTDFADGGRFWMSEGWMRSGDLWVVDKPAPWAATAGGQA